MYVCMVIYIYIYIYIYTHVCMYMYIHIYRSDTLICYLIWHPLIYDDIIQTCDMVVVKRRAGPSRLEELRVVEVCQVSPLEELRVVEVCKASPLEVAKSFKASVAQSLGGALQRLASLPTKILEFRGSDSSIISILRGGILMSTGDFPEGLSQAILVGIILVGRLGVSDSEWSVRRESGVDHQSGRLGQWALGHSKWSKLRRLLLHAGGAEHVLHRNTQLLLLLLLIIIIIIITITILINNNNKQ